MEGLGGAWPAAWGQCGSGEHPGAVLGVLPCVCYLRQHEFVDARGGQHGDGLVHGVASQERPDGSAVFLEDGLVELVVQRGDGGPGLQGWAPGSTPRSASPPDQVAHE